MPDRSIPAPAWPRGVLLAGSTTMQPHMQRLAEAWMDEGDGRAIVAVEGSSTVRGYKAVLSHTADIAMATGPVPEEFADAATPSRAALHSVTIGVDRVDILVHATNPVAALGATQLAAILAGRIGNWREVGGPDSPIVVLVGPPGGGVAATMKALLGADTGFTPSRQVLPTAERLRRAAVDRSAITYGTGLQPAGMPLKALAIDGRTSGMPGYPIRTPTTLVVAGQPSPAARAFIAYVAANWRHYGPHGRGDGSAR